MTLYSPSPAGKPEFKVSTMDLYICRFLVLDLKAGNLSCQMHINASVVATVQLTRFWLDVSLGAELLASDMGAAMLSVYGANRGCLPPFTKTVVSGLTAVRVVV